MTISRYSLTLTALLLSSCAQQPVAVNIGNDDQPSGRLVPIENVLPPIGNADQFNQLGSVAALPETHPEREAALDQSQRDYEMSKVRKRLDVLEDRQRQLEIEQRDYQ